jgi:hypothetical protein
MTAHPFDDTADGPPRDRYGRPMVVPPEGGKPRPYQRATTFAGILEDTYALSRWQQRMTAIGLATDPSLVKAVAANPGDKAHVQQVVDLAMEAAKAGAAARTGTALHRLTEQVDRGELTPGGIADPADRADVEAYLRATERIGWLDVEGFGVVDGLDVAGTWDRVGRLANGGVVIADLKTGSVEYGMQKIAVQLALYAHALPYDWTTATRSNHPAGLDLDRAVVIHLPAGQAECRLIDVDIAAGWDAVPLTLAVKDWRARRDLARDHADPVQEALPTAAAVDLIALAIADARDEATLTAIWAAQQARWQPHHTDLARDKKRALAQPHPGHKATTEGTAA